MKYLNEKSTIIIIILVAFISISSPILIRAFNNQPTLIQDQAYNDVRLANIISEKGIPKIDRLSYSGRDYIFSPYQLIISSVPFINPEKTAIILSAISGILSALLFFLILKEIGVNLEKRRWIMFVLLVSPAFIYSFSVPNKFSISILILLIGIYFLMKENMVLAAIILSISCFFSIFNVMLSLILLIDRYLKKRQKDLIPAIVLVIITFMSYYAPFFISRGISEKIGFVKINMIHQLIAGLGSPVGFSIFAVLLSLIGFLITWEYKRELLFAYAAALMLITISSYSPNPNIYLNFIVCAFAGIAFGDIIKRRWEIKFIMNLTILALVCGLLFSCISYTNRLVSMQPDKNIKSSLEWLGSYSDPNEVVFSHYSKGSFIEYWAELPVVMDSAFEYAPDPNQRYKDSNDIFHSRNLETTKELLKKYNVKYIWVDPDMKSSLVWDEPERGLLFLIRNKETFRSIYNKEGIEIWEVMEPKV